MRLIKALCVFALACTCFGQTVAASEPAAIPTLAPMLARAAPAVVNISVETTATLQANPFFQDPFFRRFFDLPDRPIRQRQQAVGSGIIYDAEHGYIVTNNHVIANADKIKVTLGDRREMEAKLVGSDPQLDVAVLKIDADHLAALPLGDSGVLRVGDYVVAIGDPFAVGQTATFGIVSALGRSGLGIERYEDFIQTDASINPGNSGGALVDLNGRLVGINTAILSQSGGNVGIGFAIPINMAKNVIAQLIKHGKVTRGQLGVTVQDVTPGIAEAMDIKPAEGALVAKVEPKTAAEEAGIKVGDVITAINGEQVRTSGQLRNDIGGMEPGATVKLAIVRDHKTLEMTAKLREVSLTEVSASKASLVSGLKLAPIPEDNPAFGKTKGVFIADVTPGSRAEDAGLQQGDIILSVDQKTVEEPSAALDIMERNKNKPLLLRILRGDATLFLVIR